MDSLLVAPVQVAQPHAIPFRTICEEHLRRKQPDFMRALAAIFPAAPAGDSVTQMEEEISRQEAAYAALASAYEAIKNGRQTGPDQELDACANSERKLKELLHRTNANALCLSGGGIRSASFCLGVLEGLARFSRNPKVAVPLPQAGANPSSNHDLMDRLDYLSTVSGGGYIGSWLMSWTYRRMKAKRTAQAILDALSRALECIERAQALWLDASKYLAGGIPAAGSDERRNLQDRLWSLAEAIGKGLENAQMAANQLAQAPGSPFSAAATNALTELREANLFNKQSSGAKILARASLAADLGTIRDHLSSAASAIRNAPIPGWNQAYGEVLDALADSSNGVTSTSFVTGGDPEPQPVRHLRSYTSFLAPELGATLDTFTLAAIVMRNLLVNWVMLIPVLIAAIGLFRGSAFLLEGAHNRFTRYAAHGSSESSVAAILIALALLAAFTAAVSLPSHVSVTKWVKFRNSPQMLFVAPIFAVSWLLSASGATTKCCATTQSGATSPTGSFWIALLAFLLIGVSIYLAYHDRVTGRILTWGRGAKMTLSVIVLTAFASAGVTSLILLALNNQVFPRLLCHVVSLPGVKCMLPPDSNDSLFIVFAVPLVTLTLMSSCSLFCALLGIYEMEEDREWWVRAGGCLLILDVVWIMGHALALYGVSGLEAALTGVAGLAVGGIGSLVGYSGATSAGTRPVKSAQLTGLGKFLGKHDLILPAVSLLATLLIAVGMVALEEVIRTAILGAWPHQPQWMPGNWTVSNQNSPILGLESAMVVLIGSVLLALLMNWMININLFSLQGMYRMRLMRAFLGASNTFRRENSFTHFDPKDTPHETDLPSTPGAPLHVINTTLNLVGTTNPAWRQRKAESFTFTPIHAGSWRLGYVPASLYGGGRGVTLATAMAVSGAAFNPNMGYQSSPLLSLLMTFFNLRLGYWLPNPKRPTSGNWLATQNENFFSKSGPSFALFPLLEELLGKTDLQGDLRSRR